MSADVGKSLNADALGHAFDKGWINEWERDFYMRIMRKRVLTTKQRAKKEEINSMSIAQMKLTAQRAAATSAAAPGLAR